MLPPLPRSPPLQESSWLLRNWKWVVPLLVLAFTLVVGAFIAMIFSMMHSNAAYLSAVATARADPQVQARLGVPIKEGWLTSGHISENMSGGHAEFAIPIEGPKASATIYLKAEKSAGDWKFSELEVRTDGAPATIDLLAGKPELKQDDSAP